MITHLEVFEISTPGDLAGFFRGKRPQLWGVGNCEILTRPLLGIVSARQINHDLAIKSDELMKQLAILRQVAFISGWHSQLEKQSLRLLLSHKDNPVATMPDVIFERRWPLPADLTLQVTSHTLGMHFLGAVSYKYEVIKVKDTGKTETIINITYSSNSPEDAFFQALQVTTV